LAFVTTYLINRHPKRPRYGYALQTSPKPFRARNESHTLEVLLTQIINQRVNLMSSIEQPNTYTNVDAQTASYLPCILINAISQPTVTFRKNQRSETQRIVPRSCMHLDDERETLETSNVQRPTASQGHSFVTAIQHCSPQTRH
ncbi:hypothetical protein BDN70DRAFT_887666, partial [Pholiota conissans]